ncbi:hypothetical protein AUF42_05785 [Francisella hispaniensis FSC454]|uniref:Uncharacterized protein n=1 Tax=Francisella hispaniensis FSC454 TaxID=1088883 RepID=A0AAC9J9E1_9GAMM|nr:hypothetical protein FSC454_03025 [Francisella hispaniensis FSC454]KYW84131.1 hypothetical protein AUF42_05785 [Francisella hispaniensis FSC454]
MATITTRQNTNNLLSSYLLTGVRTLIPSSDIATIKSYDKVNCNNSHDDIDNTVSIGSGLYYALLRYVNQYIYHITAKLFCFVGRCREYNSQFIGKYLQLGLVLVSTAPIL